MKKLITICLIMAATFAVKAQTKEETVEWLNVKSEAYSIYNYDKGYGRKTKFSEQGICYYDYKSPDVILQTILWKDITSIEKSASVANRIMITTSQNYSTLTILENYGADNISKVIKALKHIAVLCGAKMIKDDLFGN